MRFLPDIVDDQEAVSILELFSQLKFGVFFVNERRLVASQSLMEFGQFR